MIIHGDSIERMKLLPENSVDAIVTDPPYGIGFMGKEWDNFKPSVIKEGMNKDKRPKSGIASTRRSNIARTYDTSISGSKKFQNWCEAWSREALRVLKPGAFMLVSCSTRMYHRMASGIEDAGFEIRDMISWLYGSGFPKSLNIGKQVDKIQGNEREDVGEYVAPDGGKRDLEKHKPHKEARVADHQYGYTTSGFIKKTKGNSEWEGWGTALKPACEPIVVARKPLSEKNVALNVLKWGTGGINIDDCRIEHNEPLKETNRDSRGASWNNDNCGFRNEQNKLASPSPQGRFPANIILDEEAGKILDEQSGILGSNSLAVRKTGNSGGTGNCYQTSNDVPGNIVSIPGKGGASRFFYCAKASKSERNFGCEELEEIESVYPGANTFDKEGNRVRKDGSIIPPLKSKNNHPTVKPIKLMEYLVKLVSKEGATVLDPFLGSGTTAIACIKLNRKWIGIEREEDYIPIIKARIKPFMEQTTLNLKTEDKEQIHLKNIVSLGKPFLEVADKINDSQNLNKESLE